MKIGVLTYIREFANIGTNMQSYCTFKAIQKQFPNDQVEIIDYSGWKPAMKPYLTQLSFKSLLYDYIRIKKHKNVFKTAYVFSKNKLISSNLQKSIDFINSQEYDAIYVGSDTLLELKRAKEDELTTYWLDASINAKKFMIAASSHNVVFEGLSDTQKLKMKEVIDDYCLLGVRDEASYRLLSNYIVKGDPRLQLVPDPTFTLDIDYTKIETYFRKKRLSFNKPIVCLHLLRNTKWAHDLALSFKKKGYIVASLRPAYYADVIFTDLSPFEQVGLYKYFDLVITHRFHDSIFSIKNLTPVIVYPEFASDVTKHGENKNKTLFDSFNICETNYVGKNENLNAKYLFDIHVEAKDSFTQKIPFIKEKLSDNKKAYEAFVDRSRQILLN